MCLQCEQSPRFPWKAIDRKVHIEFNKIDNELNLSAPKISSTNKKIVNSTENYFKQSIDEMTTRTSTKNVNVINVPLLKNITIHALWLHERHIFPLTMPTLCHKCVETEANAIENW